MLSCCLKKQDKERDSIKDEEYINNLLKSPIQYRLKTLPVSSDEKYAVILDDDIEYGQILKKYVESLGFKVIMLNSSTELLKTLFNFSVIMSKNSKFVTVFLDNSLGRQNMNGIDIAYLISQIDYVRILGMTTNPEVEASFIGAGCVGVILKQHLTKQYLEIKMKTLGLI